MKKRSTKIYCRRTEVFIAQNKPKKFDPDLASSQMTYKWLTRKYNTAPLEIWANVINYPKQDKSFIF